MSVTREPWRNLRADIRNEKPRLYFSHAGLQDNLLYPLWAGLEMLRNKILETARPGSRWDKRLTHYSAYYYYKFTQLFVALINAIAIALFVYWVARIISPLAAWLLLALLLAGGGPLTYFGRNIWWMMWSWFLPMLITLWGMWRYRHSGPGVVVTSVIGGCVAAALAIKVMMGYEFTSTIMVAAVLPVFFYAVRYRWPVANFLRTALIVSVFCLAGFGYGFGQHWQGLKNFGEDPASVFQQRFEKRAYGGETIQKNQTYISESTDASVLSVIFDYLVSPRELAIPQILLLLPLILWYWRVYRTRSEHWSHEERHTCQAFAAAIALAFFGAVSMLVILKAHAYIHGFDIIVWYIPMNLFLFAFYGYLLERKLVVLRARPEEYAGSSRMS